MKEKFSQFFNKNYKKILILPLAIVILCFVYLTFFYINTGDIISKDISLTGGTTISILTSIPQDKIISELPSELSDLTITTVTDNSGNQVKLIISSRLEPSQITPIIEEILGFSLIEENSSIEFTGASLSADFYGQLLRAIIFAFLLMALVVFFVFGESKIIKVYSLILTLISAKLTFPTNSFLNLIEIICAFGLFLYALYLSKGNKRNLYYSFILFILFILVFIFPFYYLIIPIALALILIYSLFSVPSLAILISAVSDIIMPLTMVNLLGMKLSSAGIVAFLMLIGYSVDTDILLTTRVLRRKGDSINNSIFGAFKTGVTMTLTSIIAVTVGLIVVYSFQSILNQIFIILIIGLSVDLFNTWITNVCLIKWYAEKSKN